MKKNIIILKQQKNHKGILMNPYIFVLSALIFSPIVLADCINESGNRISCTGATKTLWHDDVGSGRTFFLLYGAVNTGLNCTSGSTLSGGFWRLDKNHPNYDSWLSLVLASSLAGNQLHVVSNPSVGGSCSIERIELRS